MAKFTVQKAVSYDGRLLYPRTVAYKVKDNYTNYLKSLEDVAAGNITITENFTNTTSATFDDITSDLTSIKNAVGTTADGHADSTIYARVDAIDEHNHSAQFVYPANANSVTVVGGVSAWALGSFTEIIPSNTISSPFDIHWAQYFGASVTDEYYIAFYAGAASSEVFIFEDSFTRDSAQSGAGDSHVQCVVMPANTRISAKLASKSGGSDSVGVKLKGHMY